MVLANGAQKRVTNDILLKFDKHVELFLKGDACMGSEEWSVVVHKCEIGG